MIRLLAGTSGWSYPSWQPGFYPAGLDRSAFLSFYAGRLDAVELNATKYRLPSQTQFESWAAQVPDGFRFAVKAPDRVERRLDVFQERVLALGDRLGCVRIVVEHPRDDGFLELLLGSCDPAIRFALDLRHPSWDGVEGRLAEAGAVRVGTTGAGAGWAYLRFRELAYDRARPRGDRRADPAHRCRLHRGVRVLPPRRPPGRSRVGAPPPRPARALNERGRPVAEAPSRSIGYEGASFPCRPCRGRGPRPCRRARHDCPRGPCRCRSRSST